jgi:hypothetical protein
VVIRCAWQPPTSAGRDPSPPIPMLAGDRLVGAFTIYRQRVRPFNDTTTALARTFADQSVIAIENARMMSALRDGAAGVHPSRRG